MPFLLFPSKDKTPRFVQYLGEHLASAVFGMLVIYCLKDIEFGFMASVEGNRTYGGMLELAGVAVTILLHLWRRDMLLTISGGTLFYMAMKQLIF